MNDISAFRARFRFRVQKKLNIKENRHSFQIADREVVLSAPTEDLTIDQSEWLVMNARGLPSEEGAREFGNRLKQAVEIASTACRLGVDTGVNSPTSSLSKMVRDAIKEKTGHDVRPNVHGIDVFADDPKVTIFSFSATGEVRAAPKPFLDDLAVFHISPDALSQNARDIVLLLNYSLMRTDPVAQIVFATSAVEMLGQQEDWTSNQRALLNVLANQAQTSTIGTDNERAEVCDAIKRSLHRVGLRQGVMRLMDANGLTDLKKTWDELYAQRSTLVHGLAPKPGTNYDELAYKTVSLCGHILLNVVAKEVKGANSHVGMFYNI